MGRGEDHIRLVNEPLQYGKAVQLGKRNVEQDEVRHRAFNDRERFEPIAGDARDDHSGIFHQP